MYYLFWVERAKETLKNFQKGQSSKTNENNGKKFSIFSYFKLNIAILHVWVLNVYWLEL